MELTLTVISFNNRSADSRLSYTWSKRGGSLGRSANNDWVLPDPQRYLSGQHALIEYRSGEFFIIDTSTNGLFVNQSSHALGKGNQLRLQQGDQLRLGSYELVVTLSHDPEPVSASAPSISSNWIMPPAGQQPLNAKHSAQDPFDFLEKNAASSPAINKEAQLTPAAHIADRACYLPELRQPEPLPAIQVEANPTDKSALPQAWWEESSTPILSSKASQEPLPLLPENLLEQAKSEPELLLPEQTPLADPFSLIKPLESIKPSEDQPSLPKVAASESASSAQAFLKGLGLSSLSQPPSLATAENWEAMGALLRLAVQGTLEILQARAEIKSAMHMELTTIQRRNNNPLKFSINAEDALAKLLTHHSDAYLSPERAMAEAYEDIRAHQLAVLAGMHSALQQVLRRFEPHKLVERLEKENPVSANIPVQRQAKLWGLFEELYSALEQECTDDFQHLFGLEFARAYEAQIAKLKRGA